MTPTDLATLPAWAADELRRQAEEIAALRAALEEAESKANQIGAMARECADDLEAELRHRFAGMFDYPTMVDRFERDMKIVDAVRAAVARKD